MPILYTLLACCASPTTGPASVASAPDTRFWPSGKKDSHLDGLLTACSPCLWLQAIRISWSSHHVTSLRYRRPSLTVSLQWSWRRLVAPFGACLGRWRRPRLESGRRWRAIPAFRCRSRRPTSVVAWSSSFQPPHPSDSFHRKSIVCIETPRSLAGVRRRCRLPAFGRYWRLIFEMTPTLNKGRLNSNCDASDLAPPYWFGVSALEAAMGGRARSPELPHLRLRLLQPEPDQPAK